MPHINLTFAAAPSVVVLLIAVTGIVAWFFYRYTLPRVSRSTRILLTALRASALSLILLLCLEPLVRLVRYSSQEPVLAILVDNSKSMGLVDRSGSRREQIYAALNDNALKHIAENATLKRYTFGARWEHSADTDSLRLDEDATDISSALHALAQERERTNLRAALLITDGNYNVGQNPVYEAERLGLPLYTVGIGDSSEQKDLLITRIAANDLVYAGSIAPVDVTIKGSGFSKERVEVTLLQGSKELYKAPLVLSPGTNEYSVRLSYTPEGEGTNKYSVKVSPLPGELTTRNNQRSFFARILKSKLTILLLAGGPGPDLSVLRQTLMEDKNFRVVSRAQRMIPGNVGFYEGGLSQADLDSADCLMLINFPTSTTSGQTLELIKSAHTAKLKPLLFVDGALVDNTKLSVLSPVLPFARSSSSTLEEHVFFRPSDAQKAHPVLSLGGSLSEDAWNHLPPLFRTLSRNTARSEATVLGFSRVQAAAPEEPLLLVRNVAHQKSLALLGYGLWRWRLMAQGNPETDQLLATFLTNSIRWLTAREDTRPVKVVPTKESFVQGEPVEFTGQLYDASAQPVENAQIRVVARQGEQEFETVLQSIGSGRYEGRMVGLGEGDYVFHAVAQSDGRSLGEDRGRFSLGEANLEYQDTRTNVSLLRQLAGRTGGRYFSLPGLAELPGMLSTQPSFTARESSTTEEVEIWSWKYTLACIVILLALEWYLRKRAGML
jgi:hypothetical protein